MGSFDFLLTTREVTEPIEPPIMLPRAKGPGGLSTRVNPGADAFDLASRRFTNKSAAEPFVDDLAIDDGRSFDVSVLVSAFPAGVGLAAMVDAGTC